MTIEDIKIKATPVLLANKIEYAAVFGSVARNEARPDSDVDILVRFSKERDISLLDHIGVAQDLEDVLHTKVDLITEKSLKEHVAPNVKKDLIVLYGNGQRQDLQ